MRSTLFLHPLVFFCVYFFATFPATENKMKTMRFAATIVEPTGVEARTEISMPEKAQITEVIAEQIIT